MADQRDAEPARGRAVLWDMDGVLVDSGPAHFAAWRRVARERGRGLSADEFRRTFGMRNQEILTLLFGDLSPADAEALADRKEAYFREAARAELTARAGPRVLLDGLARAGFRQAVASSAPPANVALVLDLLGIGPIFQAIVTGADVRRGKPDPEVFLLAARKLEVQPARCVVVEDAAVGVQAAKAAGMRCIALADSGHDEALGAADLVTSSLADLSPEVFASLVAGQ